MRQHVPPLSGAGRDVEEIATWPHLLSRELVEEYGRSCDPDDALGQIANSDSSIADLARWLAYGPNPRTLEQEALDHVAVGVSEHSAGQSSYGA